MSKNDLLKHLRANGCLLIREGKHEIWHNPSTGMTSPVPRHQTIDRILVRKIAVNSAFPNPRDHA